VISAIPHFLTGVLIKRFLGRRNDMWEMTKTDKERIDMLENIVLKQSELIFNLAYLVRCKDEIFKSKEKQVFNDTQRPISYIALETTCEYELNNYVNFILQSDRYDSEIIKREIVLRKISETEYRWNLPLCNPSEENCNSCNERCCLKCGHTEENCPCEPGKYCNDYKELS
jgi:hypothetical protein